jgi:hypothetical protein
MYTSAGKQVVLALMAPVSSDSSAFKGDIYSSPRAVGLLSLQLLWYRRETSAGEVANTRQQDPRIDNLVKTVFQ